MKKIVFVVLLSIFSVFAFSQESDFITFMFEASPGYAVGINMESALFINGRIIYPIDRFGLVLEAGSLFTPEEASFNLFMGPMMFLFNNGTWRVPLALGLNIFNGETLYYGIGVIASVHYIFTRYFYIGLNIGITYAFNNVYDELTGYRTVTTVFNEGTFTQTLPVYESRDHWGNYIYFRPSLVIGLQY